MDKIMILAIILILMVFVIQVTTAFSQPTVASAIQFLELRGYSVLTPTIANDIVAKLDHLTIESDHINAHLNSKQYVAPIDAPILLTSGDGVYELGNFSADILANGETSNIFDIKAIGFGNPDKNGTYTVLLYAGPADTEIGQVSFNVQGVFTASIYRDMATGELPAGTRIRAKMKSQIGGATCLVKIYYHYN